MRGPKTDEKSVWVQIPLCEGQKCKPIKGRPKMQIPLRKEQKCNPLNEEQKCKPTE